MQNSTEPAMLVIGAGGGIGYAVTEQLAQRFSEYKVFALSRSFVSFSTSNVVSTQLDTSDEGDIKRFISEHKQQGTRFKYVICCVGLLHDDEANIAPEKRLEDINEAQLLEYFRVNTIVPALWVKNLVDVMVTGEPSVVGCVSARVGSISDNRLGGWYGYRSSKAALNMMLKTASVEYARRAKTTALLSYHPGTVATKLSAPFQKNVAAKKLFTPTFTANKLIDLLTGLSAEQSPYYLDWEGKTIAW